MKSLGSRVKGARLERIEASPRWSGDGFRNLHPIAPGLRDPGAAMPTVTEFMCGGERRVPSGPLPALNPLETWGRKPQSGLRATWLGHSTILIEIDGARSEKHGVFFSGDTGLTTEYAAIREKLGPFDLVMLEVGAWHPAWGGARSASRCTHGTSPPRSSTSWLRRAARACSCHAWANR